MKYPLPVRWMLLLLALGIPRATALAQLSATDDFESYTVNPVGQPGGSGAWSGTWGVNSQNGGGTYLNAGSLLEGAKSFGLFGEGSAAGQSVSRAFPACTNGLTVQFSMRADYDVADSGGSPAGQRRLAFTVRSGNESSHFANQRLSIFFAAGSANFQWYDGTDRSTNAVTFAAGQVYDVRVVLNPTNRAYSFVASNRNTGGWFTYAGAWTTGAAGDPLGSVAFMMRGPSGAGNDAFLDSVSISAPEYAGPSLPGLPIREGDLWRYFKGTSTPAAQGTNQWYQGGYNDSAWLGPSPSGFGYDDGDDATYLGDMAGYLSVFTRKTFVVGDTSTVTHLTLGADYDDGLVAYLNGVEVARLHMPAGPVTHATAALDNREASRAGQDNYTCNCDPQEKEYLTLDPGLLRNGTNVLAVSGHNISLGSSDFSLIIELYTNINLVRGPILQMPNQGRVTVLWRTDAATDSVVEYGADTNYSGGVVSNATLVRQHEVELPVFSPGTTVYYRIRSGGVPLAASHFRAPKVPGQAFRFAIMSDYGSPTTNTTAVAAQALLQDPDLLITAGDNVQQNSGPPGLFDGHWFGPLAGLTRRMPMMPSLGNHDIRVARGQWYLDALLLPTNGPPGLAERNYSYDYGNVHFVVLDANAFVPDGDTTYTNPAYQRGLILTWLTNDLHQTTQQWKFVSYHHPPFTSEGSHSAYDLMTTLVAPVFERYGVNIAFQGHNHKYERINLINGVNYITVGSGGFSIHTLTNRREFSARVFNEKYDFLVVDIDGPRLILRCIDQDGEERDRFDFDQAHPFVMDGRLETNALVLASNTLNTIRLYGAIRGNYLYVAGQDAPPPANGNNDHFIFVNTNLTGGAVPANWAKSGSNMQWSAFLGDESTDGFVGWFGAAQQMLTDPEIYRGITPGFFRNGVYTNGALEGTLNLPAHFGNFPPELCLAFAPYSTTNGGVLLTDYQIPPAGPGNSVNSSEWLRVNSRDLALDLPVAEAGGPLAAEAGFPSALDGSGSSSPAGLPLGFLWQPQSGPAALILSNGLAQTTLVITQGVVSATTAVVRLTVNDTRFDSTDTVAITVNPVADSDGDGLSDLEEQTGVNNLLTWPDPGGRTSRVDVADSDGDGQGDGQEALAGTDPNGPGSFFAVAQSALPALGGFVLQWSSAAGRVYQVLNASNLLEAPVLLATNVSADPPLNSYTVPVEAVREQFYFLRVNP